MKNLATLTVALVFSFATPAQHFNPISNFLIRNSSNDEIIQDDFLKEFSVNQDFIISPTKVIQLDSIVSYHFYAVEDSVFSIKYEYLYNESSNASSEIIYKWNEETNYWDKESKMMYTYDENGNQTTLQNAIWDQTSSNWVNEFKYVRTYDIYGNEKLLIVFNWNEDLNDWEYDTKSEREYDSDGNMLLSMSWEWDTISDGWIGKHKKEQLFNSISQFEMIIFSQWDDEISDWEEYAKDEFTYDSSSFLILRKSFYLDEISGELIYTGKTKYFNNAYGNPDSTYDYSPNLWSKDLFTYDENQNLLSATLMILNNTWRNERKREYQFDDNGFQILSSTSSWDYEQNDWYEKSRRERAYNDDGNFLFYKLFDYDEYSEQLIGVFFIEWIYNENGDGLIITENLWDTITNNWFLDSRSFCYYSNPSAINKVPEGVNSIYPNPVKTTVHIECKDFTGSKCRLLDLTGKEIKQFELRKGVNNLNLEFLPPGIYLFQYADGNMLITKKIIKQ